MLFGDKPTIGIISSIVDWWWWYGNEVFRGIRAAAEERNINLRLFYGGRINASDPAERDRNVMYSMVNEHNVDGIIAIAAGLCEFLNPEEVKDYFSAFTLPTVGIGDFGNCIPQVLVDNAKGMREVICHLVDHHGFRKILFLSGPKINGEAITRLSIYKEVLKEYDIPLNPDHILYGDFTSRSGKNLLDDFLERETLDFEAIAAANDSMGLGAYAALRERGIKVPGDIALTGFDDMRDARYNFPPFTTVKQPFFLQGFTAVDMILDLLDRRNGADAGGHAGQAEETIPDLSMPAELIVRKSCGCGQKNILPEQAIRIGTKEPDGRKLFEKLADFDLLMNQTLDPNSTLFDDHMKSIIGKLYRDFLKDLQDPSGGRFCENLKKELHHDEITTDEISRWFRIVTIFSNHIREADRTGLFSTALFDTITAAHDLLEEIRNFAISKKHIQSEMRMLAYKLTSGLISPCLSFDQLLDVILVSFQQAGIDCFYIVFYPDTKFGFPSSDLPIEEGRVLLGYDGKKNIRYPGKKLFKTADLVPDRDFKYNRHNNFIISSLTSSGYHFGYMIMEFNEDKIKMYEPLVDRLCVALGTIKQFNEIEETVRKRTVELEAANEKLKELDLAKTNFMANISHELRTPLTLILGPLESLMAGYYGDTVQTGENGIFEAMHTNSVRLLRLINTLLDFSKLDAGKMKPARQVTDFGELIDFYLSSVHSGVESRGLKIEFVNSHEPLLVSIDPGLIEKAFFNLLSNAMKFSEPGSTITVSLTGDKEQAALTVKDRGIGIPRDKLTSIFERFSQVDQSASRTYEGTGIGLAFTKEIVELHGGTISVESEVGKGSVFTLRFPRMHGRAMQRQRNDQPRMHGRAMQRQRNDQPRMHGRAMQRERNDQPRMHGRAMQQKGKTADTAGGKDISKRLNTEFSEKADIPGNANKGEMKIAGKPCGDGPGKKDLSILVVDDNSNMRDFIKGLLENTYTVITAVNGKEALESIKHKKPDLIISDVMMPEIDGLELCRILKEHKETSLIPLILLTARMDMTTRFEGLEGKADDYLLKPFNARELFARITNLLGKYRLEQELKATTAALWSEMETARKIQDSLLPANPAISGFDIACYIKSADVVSGDYYDVIRTGLTSWIIIGDVSGHGITAGLVMMMVQTAIHTLVNAIPGITPARLLSLINGIIKNNISKLGQEKFMTITVFALLENNRVLFSGLHQDIYIYRAKKSTVEVIESKGMWIGFIDDISARMHDETFSLSKGDTLLVYTDGITEALKKSDKNRTNNERFGNERLLDIFFQNGHKTPQQIKSALMQELDGYVCDDDFTFMVLQCKE